MEHQPTAPWTEHLTQHFRFCLKRSILIIDSFIVTGAMDPTLLQPPQPPEPPSQKGLGAGSSRGVLRGSQGTPTETRAGCVSVHSAGGISAATSERENGSLTALHRNVTECKHGVTFAAPPAPRGAAGKFNNAASGS